MTAHTDPTQLLAEQFLQEAVYRSRGDQAGATLLAGGSAGCGLGEKPSVVLDLSPRAEELFEQLFPPGKASETDLDRVREVMADWVRRQDALDRKRNHFLRDFRALHGADRRVYDEETLSAFEAGLDRVNREVSEARGAAARRLLGQN